MPGRAGRASRATHAARRDPPQAAGPRRPACPARRWSRLSKRVAYVAERQRVQPYARRKARIFFRELPNEPIRSGKFIRKHIRKRAGSAGSTQEAHRKHTRSAGKEEHRAPHSVFRTHAGVHNPGILRFFLSTEVRRRTPARYEPCGPASRRVLHVCAALQRCTVTELGTSREAQHPLIRA